MDVFKEIEFSKIRDEFYNLAMSDFRHGMTVNVMNEVLKSYEEMEMYEACAGIHKAMLEMTEKENKL
jgi:hypothetical protein